jgi:hypothetical protein
VILNYKRNIPKDALKLFSRKVSEGPKNRKFPFFENKAKVLFGNVSSKKVGERKQVSLNPKYLCSIKRSERKKKLYLTQRRPLGKTIH